MYSLNNDIKNVLSKYELLKYSSANRKLFGEIELLKEGIFIDIFNVEIFIGSCFPKCFPKVIETDEKIPRTIKRHVMPNTNHLCLAVPIEEFLLCQGGISLMWFLDDVLVPRLCEEFRVNNGEQYQKEYSHDFGGTWEFLMKKFNVEEPDKILYFLKILSEKNTPSGNSHCICGSNELFRVCHRKNFISMQHLGLSRLKSIYNELKEKPYRGVNL